MTYLNIPGGSDARASDKANRKIFVYSQPMLAGLVKLSFALYAGLAVGAASADEPETSWRLQGPAFSDHFSNMGAPAHGDGPTLNDGNNPLPSGTPPMLYSIETLGGTFSPYAGETANAFCDQVADSIQAQGIATGHPLSTLPEKVTPSQIVGNCLDLYKHPYQVPNHQWNQTNAELGIEYDRRFDTTVERFYAGSVVDSYYKPGVYLGAAYQWSLYRSNRFNVDAGATAMLWWRSVPNDDGSIRRRWLPVGLPVLSIEDKKLGIGTNLSFIPGIRSHGTQYSVDTLMLQVTWALPFIGK